MNKLHFLEHFFPHHIKFTQNIFKYIMFQIKKKYFKGELTLELKMGSFACKSSLQKTVYNCYGKEESMHC